MERVECVFATRESNWIEVSNECFLAWQHCVLFDLQFDFNSVFEPKYQFHRDMLIAFSTVLFLRELKVTGYIQ